MTLSSSNHCAQGRQNEERLNHVSSSALAKPSLTGVELSVPRVGIVILFPPILLWPNIFVRALWAVSIDDLIQPITFGPTYASIYNSSPSNSS